MFAAKNQSALITLIYTNNPQIDSSNSPFINMVLICYHTGYAWTGNLSDHHPMWPWASCQAISSAFVQSLPKGPLHSLWLGFHMWAQTVWCCISFIPYLFIFCWLQTLGMDTKQFVVLHTVYALWNKIKWERNTSHYCAGQVCTTDLKKCVFLLLISIYMCWNDLFEPRMAANNGGSLVFRNSWKPQTSVVIQTLITVNLRLE